ncbi:MAG: ABC transporter permease subunit, partial [Anaerolineae bacterium]|nr:ABC transporter permease subunit [Anaerolineae bacterium]
MARNNNELLAKWGNLVNRVLKFAIKHFESRVPDPGSLRPLDEEIIARVEAGVDEVAALYERVKLRDALQATVALATEVNVYLDRAPWFGETIKQDKPAAATTIYTALRCIDTLNRLFAPVLALIYPIPKVVFLPVFLIVYGINDDSKIALIVSIVFFQILVVVRDEAQRLPPDLLASVRSLGAGRRALYWFVYLPASLGSILTAWRVSVGPAVAVLYIAEITVG